MTADLWGGDRDVEAAWWAATEHHLRHPEPPPLSLRDLAVHAVMAVDLVELGQVVQAAITRFGDDALDLSCPVPGSCSVVPLGTLIARRAGEITA